MYQPSHIRNVLRHHMEHVMRQAVLAEVVHHHDVVQAVLYGGHAADAHGGARQHVGAVERDESR